MEELIEKIKKIFDEAPRINKAYICHGEYHSYTVRDNEHVKQQLKNLFQQKDLIDVCRCSACGIEYTGEWGVSFRCSRCL